MYGLAGREEELADLVERLDKTSTAFGMQINAEKTKLMTNNTNDFSTDIRVNGEKLDCVNRFKYLGAIIADEGSKLEILARIAQATAALTKLKTIWNDRNIALSSMIRLMRSLVISIFLCAWHGDEMPQKASRHHISNEEVRNRTRQAIGPYEDLLTTVKRRKLKWYGHITRSSGLAKKIMQGTVQGGRRRGRQKKRWEDNNPEWTGMTLGAAMRKTERREEWRELVARSYAAPQRSIKTTG
ncbi:hypothetical protein NP493_100g02015 [Ridgeia piscesae]|uniref:Endonuclease-reverse transcriptase n=1 Tax=Ridgeia piscesae TaxID=27915 RepID=A0AAD9UHH2_RIDPI|nr:hypothetical protein NP493_100g02015 [Ridgeia piscesae]